EAFSALSVCNQVLLVLVLVSAVAVATTGFVAYAPNRLVSGEPIPLWQASGGLVTTIIILLSATLLAACFAAPREALHFTIVVVAISLLLMVSAAAGHAASALSTGAAPASRISLGTAFWVLIATAALAVVDALQRLAAGPTLQLLAAAVVVAGAIGLGEMGT